MDWFLHALRLELFRLSNTAVTPVSLLVFVATVLATLFVGRIVHRTVEHFFTRRAAANRGLAYAIARVAQYSVVLGGVLVALDNLGLSLTSLAAAGAILTVGIGFGLQNIAQNFISGLILLVERPVQKGDFVIIGNTVGTVDEISMRATRVLSRDGVAIIVPNSELITGTVINQSAPTSRFRARIAVGVAYGSDTALVRETLLAIARAHPGVLAEPAPLVFFRAFGESSLDFELAVWLDDPQPEPLVTSDLRFAIEAAFRTHKIVIPFPQRELHLRGEVAGRAARADAAPSPPSSP